MTDEDGIIEKETGGVFSKRNGNSKISKEIQKPKMNITTSEILKTHRLGFWTLKKKTPVDMKTGQHE